MIRLPIEPPPRRQRGWFIPWLEVGLFAACLMFVVWVIWGSL